MVIQYRIYCTISDLQNDFLVAFQHTPYFVKIVKLGVVVSYTYLLMFVQSFDRGFLKELRGSVATYKESRYQCEPHLSIILSKAGKCTIP